VQYEIEANIVDAVQKELAKRVVGRDSDWDVDVVYRNRDSRRLGHLEEERVPAAEQVVEGHRTAVGEGLGCGKRDRTVA
jgi:hypothetical protein